MTTQELVKAESKIFVPDMKCAGYSRVTRAMFDQQNRVSTKPTYDSKNEEAKFNSDIKMAGGILLSLMLLTDGNGARNGLYKFGMSAPQQRAIERVAFTKEYTESHQPIHFLGVSSLDMPRLVTSEEKTEEVIDYIHQAAHHPSGGPTTPDLVIAHDLADLTGEERQRSDQIVESLHQLKAPNYRVIIFCGKTAIA